MRKTLALIMLAALLPACGLKGPLYLPQKPAADSPPAAAPASDAQSDTKKNPAPVKK